MPNSTKSQQKAETPKKNKLNPKQRAQRSQQILFGILGLIVILSMVLSLTLK